LLIGDPDTPAFKIEWDGGISINENSFRVDSKGHFWVNGETLSKASFSVTNEGVLFANIAKLNTATADSLITKTLTVNNESN
jgi:hypothetical protein